MYLELFFLARQIIATLLQSSCVLTMYSKFLNKRIGYSPFFSFEVKLIFLKVYSKCTFNISP